MNIDYKKAASYWTDKEADAIRMPEQELKDLISSFLKEHKVGALATAGAGVVRSTPIEYFLNGEHIYMFSEGGLKFQALEANENACFSIFDPDPSFGSIASVQISGIAHVIEPFCQEYLDACEARGLKPEKLRSLPFTMNLIRFIPSRYDLLLSSLKGQGYNVRQWLDISDAAED